MMRGFFWSVFALGLSISLDPVEATVLTIAFQGHVTSGEINKPSFGLSAGFDPAGEAFEATFVVDDSLGSLSLEESDAQSGEYYTELVGGYQLNPIGDYPSPVVSGSFQMNGASANIPGLYLGDISKYYYPQRQISNYSLAVETLSNDPLGLVDEQFSLGIDVESSAFSSADFRDPGIFFNTNLTSTGIISADLLTDPNGDPVTEDANIYYLRIHADSVTVSQVSGAVPEAPTWAMLLAGFAVAGMNGRNRRATFSRFRQGPRSCLS